MFNSLRFVAASFAVMVGVSKFTAQSISQDELNRLQYSGPIQFSVDVVQTPQLSDKDYHDYLNNLLANNRQIYEKQNLSEDRIQRQLDSITRSHERDRTAEHQTVTFAANNTQDLYTEEVAGEKQDVFSDPSKKVILLFDGKQDCRVSPEGRGVFVQQGRSGNLMSYFPVIGISIPDAPLAKPVAESASKYPVPDGYKRCLVPTIGIGPSGNDIFGYYGGFMKFNEVDGAPQVTDMYAESKGSIWQDWKFSSFKKVNAKWIATVVTWTEFVQVRPGERKPYLERVFTIKNLSSNSIPNEMFILKSYIKKGAEVTEMEPSGMPHRFKYDPDKSWDEMRKNDVPIR